MTVSTTVDPAGIAPASARSRRPATEIAEAGSTKIPTSCDSSRWAARMPSSLIAPKNPELSSRAASASSHEAGLPMRMALAMVSGFFTGSPSTMGALPAAWNPNMRGSFVVAPRSSSSR